MNFYTNTPTIFFVATIVYILFCIGLVQFILSKGKNQKRIIKENNKSNTSNQFYVNKYPEANLRSTRRISLALGFIFALTSTIYAFSLVGNKQAMVDLAPLHIDSSSFIAIEPPVQIEEKKLASKKSPPPIKFKNPKIIIQKNRESKIKLKNSSKPKKEDKKTAFTIPIEKEFKEEKTYIVVEEMPRFVGCQGVGKTEIMDCTSQIATIYCYHRLS